MLVDAESPRHDDHDPSYPPSLTAQSDIQLNSAPILPIAEPDEGYAWVFLAAAFTIETLVWGYGFAVGIFHEYWTKVLFPQPEATGVITTAATLLTGAMYCSALVFGPLITRYPEYRHLLQLVGLTSSVSGIVGSAFATKPWHLIVTAGLLYPLGGGLAYLPAATMIFEWFNTKRGIASGIMYSGTGFGGAVFPFIIQALLDRFSYKAAVISLGLGYFAMGLIAVLLIKERVPIPKRTKNQAFVRRKVPFTFLKRNTFWLFTATIALTSLGNFLPSIYLPSYAADLGLSTSSGTLLVSIMNASSIAGLLILGWLSDVWPTRLVVAISCWGAALSCFLLWGFATSLTLLIIFAILFGFTALAFASVWTKLITIVSKDEPLAVPMIFSIFAFARGIGNVCSGPISNALLQSGRLNAKFGYGLASYGPLLLYTGGIIAAGSLTGMVYRDKQD